MADTFLEKSNPRHSPYWDEQERRDSIAKRAVKLMPPDIGIGKAFMVPGAIKKVAKEALAKYGDDIAGANHNLNWRLAKDATKNLPDKHNLKSKIDNKYFYELEDKFPKFPANEADYQLRSMETVENDMRLPQTIKDYKRK